MIKTKLDVAKLTKDLEAVNNIAEKTDDVNCLYVCNMFKDLCTDIAQGAIYDKFTMAVAEAQREREDNSDHPERHNVAGSMNRPSLMQELAFKKGEKDEK